MFTGEAVALLTDGNGMLLVQKGNLFGAIGCVTLMTINTGGGVGRLLLPLRQKYVEMVVEIAALGDVAVTFYAVDVVD